MVFVCDKCQKIFSSKQRMSTHVNSNVCIKQIEKLTCKHCLHKFADNTGYNYHLEHNVCKKTSDNNTTLALEIEKMKLELQLEEEKTKQKQIEDHMKQIEDHMKQVEAEEKTKQKQIDLEIVKEKMIVKMKLKSNNTTNVTNVTNVNNSNNTYNIDIHPVAFGKEDFSELNDEQIIRYILNRPNKAIEDIVNIIYCSKKNKLNHTVYIPSRNKSIAMVSNGNRFIHRDANETIDEIYGNSKDKLDEMLESNGNKLSPFQIKVYSDIEYNPKHEAKVKRNIKFDIIDMEPVIKNEINT